MTRRRDTRSRRSEDDESARLCEREAGRLTGYLVARGTNPGLVDDIIQDTFLVVYRKGEEVTSHPNPTAYLFKIARGVAADKRRADESRFANEVAWYQAIHRQSRDSTVSLADFVDALRALQQLSRRQREVVYLHLCVDLTLDEAADILGVTKGAVNEHLRRAKKRLHELLDDAFEGSGHASG